MAGTIKLAASGANEPKGTTLPPSPPATNPQTGGLYVLALQLRKRNASNARTENLYSHNNPKAANAANTRSFVVKAKPQRKSCRCAWPC